jgi:hypothetical protein
LPYLLRGHGTWQTVQFWVGHAVRTDLATVIRKFKELPPAEKP